ncbi:hypothetical protein ACFTXM_19305 [Streptomyces sp. NPDC056930]|uniref:hypothetical protein n=1 Tax=Streptomyces sp. NPDC056930 TaxID=3345967 RepID=UPI003634A3E3
MGAVLVAAVGIPATVLVGRWQTRAALRSAEATSQAGIAQAEAAYRAALDQAAAQTTATHEQWRRGIRRDTWAAFLLAVEDAVSSGHSALNGTDEDLPALRRAVKTTLVVLELEGPPPIVEAAKLLRLKCNDYLELVEGDLLASRAWHVLESAAQEERANLSSNAATPVHDAQAALSTLVPLMRGVRDAAGRRDPVPWGLDPNAEPEAVYERIEQAHTAAAAALANCPAVSDAQARALLHDAAHGGRFEMSRQAHDSLEFLDQARSAFLEAARAQLDTTQ